MPLGLVTLRRHPQPSPSATAYKTVIPAIGRNAFPRTRESMLTMQNRNLCDFG
jgi:hypothetical protein